MPTFIKKKEKKCKIYLFLPLNFSVSVAEQVIILMRAKTMTAKNARNMKPILIINKIKKKKTNFTFKTSIQRLITFFFFLLFTVSKLLTTNKKKIK